MDENESSGSENEENVLSDESEIEDDDISNHEENAAAQAQSVKNQLIVWDLLLNSRIKLQKLLLSSNKLPQLGMLNVFLDAGGQEVKAAQAKAVKEEDKLMKALLKLDEAMKTQSDLISKPDERGSNNTDQIEEDNDVNNDGDDYGSADEDTNRGKKRSKKVKKAPEVEDDSNEKLEERHKRLLIVGNNVMDNWFQKTRYATRGGKLDRKSLEDDVSIVTSIEQILNNRERLLKKTRLRRSDYDILGKVDDDDDDDDEDNKEKESKIVEKTRKEPVDVEIYDDDDFYRQLLRQLIESKTSPDTADPIALSRRWLEVQKLRSKMKKKIDTRASKGRKIRYQVHQPLISFMAPMEDGIYEDDAKDALFSSLFNKRKYQDL